MPPTHTEEGLEAAREIRARHPETAIVILSQHVEVGIAMRVLVENPERLGYLLKDRVTDIDDFAATLRHVAAGGSALDPQVVSQLLAGDRDDGPLSALTPREREVLELIAEGRSNKGIGERLDVSTGVVQKHVGSLFAKLGIPDSDDDHRRILAVLTFLRSLGASRPRDAPERASLAAAAVAAVAVAVPAVVVAIAAVAVVAAAVEAARALDRHGAGDPLVDVGALDGVAPRDALQAVDEVEVPEGDVPRDRVVPAARLEIDERGVDVVGRADLDRAGAAVDGGEEREVGRVRRDWWAEAEPANASESTAVQTAIRGRRKVESFRCASFPPNIGARPEAARPMLDARWTGGLPLLVELLDQSRSCASARGG